MEESYNSIIISEAGPGYPIVYVNPAFTLMTGYEPEEVIGKSPSILRKDASTVLSTDMLDTVITKLSECRCDLLPVTQEGKLVGVLTTDNLGAFMRLREAAAN